MFPYNTSLSSSSTLSSASSVSPGMSIKVGSKTVLKRSLLSRQHFGKLHHETHWSLFGQSLEVKKYFKSIFQLIIINIVIKHFNPRDVHCEDIEQIMWGTELCCIVK